MADGNQKRETNADWPEIGLSLLGDVIGAVLQIIIEGLAYFV